MNSKQQRAKRALDELIRLKLTQREVAERLGVDPTYIAHINGIGVHPEYHVSEERARALENLVLTVQHEYAQEVVDQLPVIVRHTANNQGTVVDESVREQIRRAIQTELTHLATGRSVVINLPSGVHGAVADIGPNMRIFVASNLSGEVGSDTMCKEQIESQINMLQHVVQQYRLYAHEIQHAIDDLRCKLPADKRPYRPESAY